MDQIEEPTPCMGGGVDASEEIADPTDGAEGPTDEDIIQRQIEEAKVDQSKKDSGENSGVDANVDKVQRNNRGREKRERGGSK